MAEQLITEAEARQTLGPRAAILLGDELASIVASANSDPGEGPEWLPWYKLSLGLLMEAFGRITSVADKGIEIIEATDPVRARRMRLVRRKAMEIVALHMRACGVGPETDPVKIARAEEIIRDQWRPLMEGPLNG